MDLELGGKSVAVMAASRGLGRAVAEAFVKEGARVSICAREAAALQTSVRELRSLHPDANVEGFVSDVRDAASVRRFIADAARFGGNRVDVLVTNNGGPRPGRFDELSDDDWTRAFEVLVLSNVNAVRAALPFVRASRGSIINIVSTSVKQPISSLVLSNSLRMAVVGLAKSLANDLAREGVRVNNVCPGSFETERIMELLEHQAGISGNTVEELRAQREREIPIGRFGRPHELADVIAFLASPRASYITGATLSVDGGVVRWTYG